MRKLLLALFLTIITGSGVMAQVNQNFSLVNQTGLAIDQLFISPSDVEDWEEDVLGVDVLPNEQSADITFAPKEERCDWDIKIIDAEGDEVVWDNIDLCKAVTVTLYWNNGTATAEIENAEDSGSEETAE